MSAEYRRYAPWRRTWRALFTGEALAAETDTASRPQTFAREVVNVDMESPTRAVVLARIRNTTPIPPGATPTESDVKRRRDGEVVRYILEKDTTGWRIAQAQQRYIEGGEWSNRWDTTPTVPSYSSP
jgi:hypothetical protein